MATMDPKSGAQPPEEDQKPYIPEDQILPELSVKTLSIGVLMAAVLGAANAYLGLKAGLTVAATFPAAVVAMAIVRLWKGNILQENLIRTTASVGEALVAGAIFTIPAFVMVGYWEDLFSVEAYLEGTALILAGGLLGVLFVIILRRPLCTDRSLPFPESVAAAEIHKAGQHGATGAKYLFGMMGLSALIELFKNANGLTLIKDYVRRFLPFGQSKVEIAGKELGFQGGFAYETPIASPALMGVGYIIGPKLSSWNFSGGLLAWLVLIPLVLFVNGDDGSFAARVEVVEAQSIRDDVAASFGLEDATHLAFARSEKAQADFDALAPEVRAKADRARDVAAWVLVAKGGYDAGVALEVLGGADEAQLTSTVARVAGATEAEDVQAALTKVRSKLGSSELETEAWTAVTGNVWTRIVRPFAVGAMIVGAVWTLFRMRKSLLNGIKRSIGDMKNLKAGGAKPSRLDFDIPIGYIFVAILCCIVPITGLYWYFTGNPGGALTAALVMVVAGFFFSAVAGYLVGVIGSSSSPISGMTLSTLIVAALLMVSIGVTGTQGVVAVLAVAAVVCCACGVSGDMIQDLKVGQLLGGTPWRMEIAELISVLLVSFVLILPIALLHTANEATGGIGGSVLPAPQAGLMKLLAQGIVGGNMAWSLVIAGAFFAVALILIGAPSPMLIAVGMYLPFHSTFAIFVGGCFRWLLDLRMGKQAEKTRERAGNIGVLMASGLIAGEALMAMLLAIPVALEMAIFSPIMESPWIGGVVIALVGFCLIRIPNQAAQRDA